MQTITTDECYLVGDGVATLVNPVEVEMDGSDSVLVLARDEDRALDIARQYDAKKIDYDNVFFCGVTIAVLRDLSAAEISA